MSDLEVLQFRDLLLECGVFKNSAQEQIAHEFISKALVLIENNETLIAENGRLRVSLSWSRANHEKIMMHFERLKKEAMGGSTQAEEAIRSCFGEWKTSEMCSDNR